MKQSSLRKLIRALLASIILTAVNAFAEEPLTDRTAYAKSAFEAFHGVIYFLSGNDRFLTQLTPEERNQFMALGGKIIKHRWVFGPAAIPGQSSTSKMVDFRLRFSDRREDFILNPGEPERTAKMDGDIWFNLNVINNPKVRFGLLDAFQIMFHEFGHKLEDQKNQVLIDNIAAKMRTTLAGFYKETEVIPGLKGVALAIPYVWMAGGAPVDFQPEPIVIFDRNGRATQAQFKVASMQLSGQKYIPNQAFAQAYGRTVMTPEFTHYQDSSIMITWNVSTRHFFYLCRSFQLSGFVFEPRKSQTV